MAAMTQWRKIYHRWKLANPTAKIETRARMVRGCVGKFAYPEFLSAMLACASLDADKSDNRRIGIYHCSICGKAHIGNNRSSAAEDVREAVRM